MAVRYYRNGPATTLVAGIGSADTVITVADASGFPSLFPYTLIIDRDQATEEVVDVTGAAGNQLTVTRGVDGTPAFPHSAGAVVAHGISARDPREANQHINATSAVHGVTGSLVGTTDIQTLSGKTLTSPTVNGGTITNATLSGGTANGLTIRDTSIVQPNSGNSQNPLSIRDVGGVERGYIDRNGALQAARLRAENTDPASVGLVVKGAASQTADLVSIRNSADTAVITVDELGRMGINVDPGSITLYIQSPAATDVPFRIRRLAGQTTNLVTVVDETNAIMFWVDGEGKVHAPNLTDAGIDQSWQSITPSMANVGGATISSRTLRWKRIAAKTVAFHAQITFGSSGSGVSPTQFALPTVPSRTIRQSFTGSSENPQYIFNAVVLPSGTGALVDEIRFTDPLNEGIFTANQIQGGMTLNFSGVYEEA